MSDLIFELASLKREIKENTTQLKECIWQLTTLVNSLGDYFMSVNAQLASLNTAIAALSSEETSILSTLADLQIQLTTVITDFEAALSNSQPIDLTALLAALQAVQTGLDNIGTAAAAADTAVKAAIPATVTPPATTSTGDGQPPATTPVKVTEAVMNADTTVSVTFSDGTTETLPAGSAEPAIGSIKTS